MKPFLEHIASHQNASIIAREFKQPNIDIPWHFHPEYEIILFIESTGKVFIGNGHTTFGKGDIFFIGSGVPHLFLNDKIFYEHNSQLFIQIIVIHFRKDLFDSAMQNYSEFERLKQLFRNAESGIKLSEERTANIAELILEMPGQKGLDMFANLIKILNSMDQANDPYLISQENSADIFIKEKSDKLRELNTFLINNYNRDIGIEEAANTARMNPSAFCRYFKKHTRMTFSDYLNRLRINYACRLLVNNTMTVSQICYEVGYNNISHFNRQFKRICKKTPLEYKKEYHTG